MDIISHIKDLLYAKRWSREQIIELNASGHRMVPPIVLCINDNPIALVLSFPDNCVNDDMVNYCINELKSQSVKVGFIYSGEYNIFLISILNSREEITHLDDFLTPGETLSLIYYHTYKYTPYLVLLPKLILGTLEFIIAFINCLFSLFNENKQLLRYYYPQTFNNNPYKDSPLYNYLLKQYPEYIQTYSSHEISEIKPLVILVPYEVHLGKPIEHFYPNYYKQVGQIHYPNHSFINTHRIIKLSTDEIQEQTSAITRIQKLLIDSQILLNIKSDICHCKGIESAHLDVDDSRHIESNNYSNEGNLHNIEITLLNRWSGDFTKNNHQYKKITLTDINMARQTSYQTQIELAEDLKRYLHGFQERLVEVAKNYLAKSHDLYDAGMMDETHKDFEENYVHKTISHIAEVVELINERDIPFVEKYIDQMEQLYDQYNN